ncbi:MAG: DEAD/DEAH box helicase, partial [Planctomycetaceae bacterium]|nr:DEAD/DEAH box helicase [Planctomycetaceae bacterium]
QLEELRVAPQGLLRVLPRDGVAPRGWLPTELLFDYSGQRIRSEEPATGMLNAASDRYCHRDFEQETALENRLLELGLQPRSRNNWAWGGFSDEKTPPYELRETEMVRTVAALIDEGWLVEAEGRPLRNLSHSSFRVNSAVDWFELEGEFDFDGASARLPELLAAARNGQRFLQLDDGSQGLLPQDWLKRFGSMAELGQAENGTVRFQPSQALLLDSMLEAQDSRASVDRQFAAFRRKLRSFSGVKPRNAPRGFHGDLREYQRDGLGWLNFLQKFGFGGCLADDMGLGKTIQVLALLESRRVRRKSEGETHAPSLAVVPKSLIFNWLEEAARFTPNLRVAEYHGTDRAQVLEQAGELDLIVTTYGTLRQDIATLKEIDFDYAILDEAQAIKNAQSQAAKACRLLKSKHRLAMTGTPIENHLGELWSLFEFLNPGLLGRSKAFQQISKQSADQPESLALLARAVSPYILRRTRQQVLPELPEKTEQTLYVELPKQQRRLYNELRDHYRALLSDRIETEGLQKSKIHVLEALLRLRQAACHSGLLDRKRHEDSSAKFDLLMEQLAIVIEEGSKALIFSQFTSLLGLLRERLDETGVGYEYLDGKTSNRQEPVRRFQEDPDCRLFLISIKAGGFGLNLTAAEFVYILDPWWNPAVEAQAVARSHRIGQLKPMRACRLIARDTIEEKIVQLQQSKQELADAVINSSSSLIQQLTAEDLQLLLT